MEVILREHVEHLGRRGDIVKVAAGYGRNFLLPRKLALAVTENNRRQIEREKKLAEVKDLEDQRAAEAVAERISQLEIEIARRVGDHDTLYGSVTSADVAQALKTKGFDIDKRKIQMPETLKTLGETVVPIKIHHGVVAQVKVRVVAEKKQ
jgi:large subunit ribosomal protein L9